MIGRFLLGAFSGLALVASGLIAGSALFPLRGPGGEPATDAGDPTVTKVAPSTESVEAVVEPTEPTATETAEVEAEAQVEPAEEPVEISAAQPEAGAEEANGEPAPAPTETAQPAVTEEVAAIPEPAAAEEPAAAAEPSEVTSPATPEAPAAPTSLTEDPAAATETAVAAEVAQPEVVAPTPETDVTATDIPTPETSPETTPEAEAAPAEEAAPDSATPTEPEAEAAPEAQPEADAEAGTEAAETGSTFAPSPGFASEGAITDRDEAIETGPEPASDTRPISLYAAGFDNPDGKPVLAIVLVDPGTATIDRAELAALPFPVSFALDPMDPATPEYAAIYRAAGREVIMLATGIAEGSQASDVEVAFQSMAQRLPEAVAIMDLAEPVFQDNRSLASLVVPVIGAEGLGVLSWDKGLNAADQVARREDVASAVIFRDLATGGGDASATKRTLDRAVFKAGQDGRAVVAGTVTPELLAGLLEWSVEGRAGEVALGPLTAALQVD